jgi:hypothetical protein
MFESREDLLPLNDQDINPIEDEDEYHNQTPQTFEFGEESKSGDSNQLGRDATLNPCVDEFLQASAYGEPDTYYRFGVIDFLQAYTGKKKIETMLLRKRFSKKPLNCFSCVDPNTYGDRFYNFLVSNLFTNVREFPEHEIFKKEKEVVVQLKEEPVV